MTIVPWKLKYLFRCARDSRDVRSALRFLLRRDLPISFADRLRFIRDIYVISFRVWCAHSQEEILEVTAAILAMPRGVEGVVVEAGCYKGGSTAKLSLAAKLAQRRLIAFDSFEGLPDNEEQHQRSLTGEVADFRAGVYRGGLEEVRYNVAKYGDIDCCTFVKGWFSDTMPGFSEPVVAAFIDVDLVSSTRDCMKHLYPRLQPGAAIFSQDGHLPLVIKALDDRDFWEHEVGFPKPRMIGLGSEKLVRIIAA